MWEVIKNIFSPSQYMPHGHCYLWQTPLVGLHIVSDLLIAIAYFSIPAMLIYFISKRRDVPFLGVFALFGAFIILCGMGHLLDIWTLWHPAYWLSGAQKAATALVSCYTAGQMLVVFPQLLSLKTPEQLEAINQELGRQIVERQQVELALRRAYDELEEANATLKLSEAREREKSQQLTEALHQLKSTQVQIVHSEKMASLGHMVAGVAHEINNPVSFIYGNIPPAIDYAQNLFNLLDLYQQYHPQPAAAIQQELETLELDFLKEDFIKLLQSMQTGADRIKKIVLSLRDFSRSNSAKRKAADLIQGLENALMILQHRLHPQPNRPAIQVIKNYSKLPLIECYPEQLNQVFINLLINAIDALEEKFEKHSDFIPQICLRTETREHPEQSPKQSAIIRISDNGIGISPKIQKCIFDPFFTTKPVGKGTGLGLFISYQIIVEKHKGKLECYSQLGEGTELVIELA